jgi:flagellar basal body-associated protein FliL
MKNSKLKIVGIVLLVGAVVAAALIQMLGSGLVATEHVSQHVQTADPRITVTATATTTYHLLRILPLLAVALFGAIFLLVSRGHEKPAA